MTAPEQVACFSCGKTIDDSQPMSRVQWKGFGPQGGKIEVNFHPKCFITQTQRMSEATKQLSKSGWFR